jgi:protein involved in polysaccharide export with SLBB domain
MHLVSMTIRSAFVARWNSRRKSGTIAPAIVRAVCAVVIALAASIACAQSSSPAAESSAARNLLAPAPANPAGPSVTTNSVNAPSGYVLSANDQVAVEVFGEDDLRTNGRLNAEGNLSLPLLGSVHLSGLTLTQATSRVTELYGRDYLVNPKVNVSLVSYAKRRFTVLGQVNHPGSFEMPEGSPGGIDLLEAIAMAGGYTRIAAPERITVRRHSNSGDEVLKVDGKRLAKGTGTSSSSFKVLPGDTITVGESIF